jgi:hypothetical protein
MVKKMLLAFVVFVGFAAAPRPAMAQSARCAGDLNDCYVAAAKIDSFWYRWAAGIDCELNFTDCVRRRIIGR